jgi:Mg-chelatase subunit ChlD
MSDVNALDLAFVIDTTGSMGGLIDAAKRQMIDMIERLSRAAHVHMQLGVVEYRDHPPQDRMVYRVHGLTENLSKARKTINSLRANGGGDEPEAVLDGILAACRELAWRKGARRIAVLVGDAPPHGAGSRGDSFPRGCPCGETIESVTAAAEDSGVTLYALGLTPAVVDSFGKLSRYTGGEYFQADQAREAIARLEEILSGEFGNLDLDRQVLSAWNDDPALTLDALAETLQSSRPAVSASVSRLGARGLLTH